jgi:hypothetical protein
MSSRSVELVQEDESCDNHEDEHLSNHTISMRAALNHCRDLLRKLNLNSPLDVSPVRHATNPEHVADAWNAAQTISQQRQEALEELSKNNFIIPTVAHEENMSVLDFRKHFLHANCPCLIQGLPHFSQASTQWRTTYNHSDNNDNINTDWFSQNLGEDTLVPVRQRAGEELDDDGRAQECATIEIPLCAWLLHNHNSSPDLYLKDWHLQKQWEEKHHTTSPLLYQVPDCFGTDLLNTFLLKFTGGDYRFVYWGPPGSQTPVHSDVLHSFSWSHNVVGKKRWTFHDVGGKGRVVVLIQNAGETVLVPSTWSHSVENLSETLSINHNWITTANIDQTWECLTKEMTWVDAQLKKWDNNSSWDAKEFMLRGCAGLDVTAFLFMVLTAQLELLTGETNRKDDWERFFDIFRLHQVLEMVSKPTVHWQERLTAVLEEDTLASEAVNAAKTSMCVVNKLLEDNGL